MRSALCARRQAGCSTRTRLEEGAAAAAGVAQLVIHKLDVQDAKAAAVDLGLRSFAQGSRRGVPQNWVQGNDQGAGLPPTSPVAAWHAQGRTNRVRAPRWPTRAPAASRTPPSSQRAAQPCATPVGSAPGQTRPRRLHPHNTRRRPACGRGATNRRSKGVQPRCGQRARVRLQRLDARLGGSRRQHVLPCSSPQHGTNPLKLPCSRRSSKRRRGRQPPPPPPAHLAGQPDFVVGRVAHVLQAPRGGAVVGPPVRLACRGHRERRVAGARPSRRGWAAGCEPQQRLRLHSGDSSDLQAPATADGSGCRGRVAQQAGAAPPPREGP